MRQEKKPSIKLLTANFNQKFQGKPVGNYHKPREERTKALISIEYSRNRHSYNAGLPRFVDAHSGGFAGGWVWGDAGAGVSWRCESERRWEE